MTREQAKQKLIALGIETPTDEQISNYLNSFSDEIQKEKTKAELDKAELERLKLVEAELQAEKDKNLTAEEKLQSALQAAEQEKKSYAVQKNRLAVEKILVSAGLTEEDYKDIIDTMVNDNLESSTKLANGFTTILQAKKEATEKAFKEDALKNMPPPTGGQGGDADPPTKTEAEKTVENLVGEKTQANKSAQETVNYYTGGSK